MNTYEKIYNLLPDEHKVIGGLGLNCNGPEIALFREKDLWLANTPDANGVYDKRVLNCCAHAIIETLARRYLTSIENKLVKCETIGAYRRKLAHALLSCSTLRSTPEDYLSAVRAAREWEEKEVKT